MAQVFLGWRRFAVWLADHSVTSLNEVDHDLLADYAAHIGRRGCSSAVAQVAPISLRRMPVVKVGRGDAIADWARERGSTPTRSARRRR